MICRAIVYADNFDVFQRLRYKAIQTAPDIFFNIITRHAYRYFRHDLPLGAFFPEQVADFSRYERDDSPNPVRKGHSYCNRIAIRMYVSLQFEKGIINFFFIDYSNSPAVCRRGGCRFIEQSPVQRLDNVLRHFAAQCLGNHFFIDQSLYFEQSQANILVFRKNKGRYNLYKIFIQPIYIRQNIILPNCCRSARISLP